LQENAKQGEVPAVAASEETFMQTNYAKKYLKKGKFQILHSGNWLHFIYMSFGLYHKK
jgi:hypothetical protein